MSAPRLSTDAPVEHRTEVSFETLHQFRRVKPTHVYRYADTPGLKWWRDAVGRTHSDYFRAHHLGAVLTYLAIDVFDVALMPQDPLTVRFQTLLGRYVSAPGKPPRYGGVDHLALAAEGGAVAARLTSYWLWFRVPPEGKPGTIAEPPPLFEPNDRLFDPHPEAPLFEGTPAGSFAWTRRETDLNQHVNSLSFLERAENVLAEAGVETAPTGTFEIWYVKPGFAGQRAAAYRQDDGAAIRMRFASAETGHPMTVLRFPARR